MSRIVSLVTVILMVGMMTAIGFLAHQVSQLNELYYATQNVEQQNQLDAEEVGKVLKGFKKDLLSQKEVINEFSANLTRLSFTVKQSSNKRYMPALTVAVDYPLFDVASKTGNTMKIIGNKKRISTWMDQNEPFIEYLMKKSLPLEYNRRIQMVQATGMTPGSLFYQMGIRDGDGIMSVNGKRMTHGMDLRYELSEIKPKKVWVLRKGKRVLLEVSYKDLSIKDVVLDLGREQFNQALPTLLSSVKTEAIGNDKGVKILELEPDNVLSLMNLKAHDVITQVGGHKVSGQQLVSALRNAHGPIAIEYKRGNKQDKVYVMFER